MQMDEEEENHREKDKYVHGPRCMVTTREGGGFVFRRDSIALIPSLSYSLNCPLPPCNAIGASQFVFKMVYHAASKRGQQLD